MATSKRDQVYRAIGRSVLKLYYEDREGLVCTKIGTAFDMRMIDFCMDVEKILKRLSVDERRVLELVHREGLSGPDACRAVNITTRADAAIASIECRLGRLLHVHGLADIGWYLGRA